MPAAPELYLDLASVTGWASAVPGERLRSGTIRLGGDGATQGERFAALFRWLWDFCTVAGPLTRIVYEAPLPPIYMRGRTNVDTATLLLGLPAVVHTVAALRGVWRVEKAHVQDVRHHFLGDRPFTFRGKIIVGRRNLPSREAKHCTGERCRELGYSPADDNEADAIALGHYCRSIAFPAFGAAATPIFEAAE